MRIHPAGEARDAELAEAVLDPETELPVQGYELLISEAELRITASDAHGLIYGRATLDQILRQCGPTLPTLRIRDWPDFPVRGYMLDVSRDRIPTLQSLLEWVRTLAALRINQLQLYTEHSFAYPGHETVWRDASPLTPDEIRELDRECSTHGIELVPNQNSFGHMERWLRHPAYRPLAEWPDKGGTPSCLAPDEQSLAFVRSLYDALLPCFSSRTLNIGCDETFELGRGRSREECERRGRGRIYLDYVLRLIEDVHARGYSVQFWGDILRLHPELTQELPKERLIALVWGYEAPQDPDDLPSNVRAALARYGFVPESLRGFEWGLRPYAKAGVPFYVCPGTSSWNSLVGRLDNARANLLDAAQAGLCHGASGYLITDWGDNGHLQPPIVSLPAVAYGAAVSWCAETNENLDLEPSLPLLLPGDPGGTLARALVRLGSLHSTLGLAAINASPLSLALLQPLTKPLLAWGELERERLDRVLAPIEEESERVRRFSPADAVTQRARRELLQAAGLARHGAWRLGHRELGHGPPLAALDADLARLIEEQAQVWLESSRPGGLEDSLARLHRARADYRPDGNEP